VKQRLEFNYVLLNLIASRERRRTITIANHANRPPDSGLAQEMTDIDRDTESASLFNHSTRVYLFVALAGERRGLKFDPELL
jgi:hypothetical protein